jgi:phosphatidylinositol-4-phosphate 3-kinase
MYEQNFQQRYGLYLEMFLNKIGPNLTKIYYDEDILMTNLQNIALAQLDNKTKQKDKQKFFSETVKNFNEELENNIGEISLPLNFKYRIKHINPENCNVVIKNGKQVKLNINFQNSDRYGDDLIISYYNDQDIRTNLITMQLFNIVHTIWVANNTKIKMPLYDVITTGRNKGLIQLLPESLSYEEIYHQKNFKLQKYFIKNCGLSEETIFNNFMTSLVAYSVANYVFGITQRNKKNINIRKDA